MKNLSRIAIVLLSLFFVTACGDDEEIHNIVDADVPIENLGGYWFTIKDQMPGGGLFSTIHIAHKDDSTEGISIVTFKKGEGGYPDVMLNKERYNSYHASTKDEIVYIKDKASGKNILTVYNTNFKSDTKTCTIDYKYDGETLTQNYYSDKVK